MSSSTTTKRPNYLFIIADDLGFSDIGCYGGEIKTPNLDRLAAEGTRMLNYHTAAACSPTRSMILSGTDAHMAGLGALIEYKRSEQGAKRFGGKPGYEGYLNKEVAPISEILQDNGYHTILSGKWHLGLRPEYGPSTRGFTKSFSLLPGACNHYGWELEGGGTGMPVGGRPIHALEGKAYKVTPNTTDDPDGFYSSNTYTTRFLGYLGERTEEEKEKPFFGYLAFSAPHWPLQSPKRLRDQYRGLYSDGPHELRKRRLAKMVELGIISADVVPHEVFVPGEYREWDTFNGEERAFSSAAMMAYAGMIQSIDENVGRVLDYLEQSGELDNTFIIFQSDNGAEGAAIEAAPVMGPRLLEAIKTYYDNSTPANIGAYNSYSWLGPWWAQAATAPSRLFKSFPTEGGVLVPAIVKAPVFANSEIFPRGGFNRAFTTCRDLAPTILDQLQIKLSPCVARPGRLLHRGRAVHPMRGKSWLPAARGELAGDTAATAIYDDTTIVGWELLSRAALKQGPWKIVHISEFWGGAGKDNTLADTGEGWELFHIERDPGETKDLAKSHPEKLAHMLKLWDEYVAETHIVWGENALEPGLSKDEAPLLNDQTRELQRAWMLCKAGDVPAIA